MHLFDLIMDRLTDRSNILLLQKKNQNNQQTTYHKRQLHTRTSYHKVYYCLSFYLILLTLILRLMKGSITRGHHLKVCKQQSRLDVRNYNFLMRIVNLWNSLPYDVISAPTIVLSEAKLDIVWRNQPIKYNYKEDLILWLTGSEQRKYWSPDDDDDDDNDDNDYARWQWCVTLYIRPC